VITFGAGLMVGYGRFWTASLVALAILCWWAADAIAPSAAVLCFVAGLALSCASPAPPARFGVHTVADSVSLAERLRLRAADGIDSAFEGDAPLAKALLVADQSEIPRAIKSRYADAGIIHMLSISGMHVTIIAGAVALVFHLLRFSVRAASIGAAVVVLVYVYVLGFPAPAVRSAVMVCVAAGCAAAQRHTSRWAVLALGALVPLVHPATVLDLGYQLSVGGMAALIASGALAHRISMLRDKGRLASLARAVLASTIATLVTGPLVAFAFGRLSLVAPLTNLVADPVLAVAQPMLFLALLLIPWPGAARFVASAAHPLLATFDAIARAGAAIPHAAITVHPTPAAAALAGIAAVAMIVACVSRFPARAVIVAGGVLCAALWVA
jgi:competence protein ComEC